MFDYELKTSLSEHKIINIMYLKGEEITLRKIRVLKINNSDIKAYCYLRHGIRHFRKDNILAAVYTN
ncbi:hypothetical protein [Desnuesiella massiliensis]|uniref:hypothetical protein n=1 Tax=Desnuesiella massiliensis TaxID=1650662 RepID=UPI0006E1C2D8|nr:hypothetical protein [Desnuesiella massiliensis]